jgi:long-chain acyl-CoA synthetase
MDVVNAIAMRPNQDLLHAIHFYCDGAVETMPLAELDRKATAVAARLHELGVRPRDRIGVMATNSPEWVLLDLAVLKLSAVLAGFEVGRFDIESAVSRYGLKLLFVDEPCGADSRIIGLSRVASWARKGPSRAKRTPTHGGYGQGDVCAIKFTSGSTGEPKGLEATVGSINESLSCVEDMFHHSDGDNILVFLRLALLQQRYWIYSALVFGHDVTVTTMERVLPAARVVGPTVIMGVPGFFEDVKTRVQAADGGLVDDLARRRSAIQSMLGGRIRYLWTGSAPAGRALLDFYNDCEVPLYEGYGLNETCIVAKNCPGAFRVGSVGKPLPNKTLRLDNDGVLIVGSRNPVNVRYTWCAAGDNERMFLPSGEVKTHDLAYLDEDGYLYILGRVDDIITLSSGRNVLVRPIEERIKRHPGVHECVLYGTGKPFLTALVSPGTAATSRANLDAFIHDMNLSLLPEQQIHALIVAAESFSLENNLLTSQFKPRRTEIHRHFARELDSVYAAAPPKRESDRRHRPREFRRPVM